MKKNEHQKWMGLKEIANHLGVSKEMIYRFLARPKAKRIPAHRIGKLWKFQTEVVDQWIRDWNA